MLTSSFIFAPGVTEEIEQDLWRRGVTSWEILRKHPGEATEAMGETRGGKLVQAVNEAQAALDAHDLHWFRVNWPEKELWRLWEGYCAPTERALVDIETTGRTPGYDQITVIGLSDGTRERAFVAGQPQEQDEALEAFLEAIRSYRLLVTFNGLNFDVPFIEKHFRAANWRCEQPHIDLIYPARALGLSGGLKDMEKQIGIVRDDSIAGMRGSEAITLWGQWNQHRDRAAYDRLVVYCKADCTNLKDFADHIYRKRWSETYEAHARSIDLDATYGEQTTLF
ncbi:MAG: ribonuclease H-like domain-containing protein [Planctomycetota bacterium]